MNRSQLEVIGGFKYPDFCDVDYASAGESNSPMSTSILYTTKELIWFI